MSALGCSLLVVSTNCLATFNMKQSIPGIRGVTWCVVELQAACGFELYLKYAQNGTLERDVMCVWGHSSPVVPHVQL